MAARLTLLISCQIWGESIHYSITTSTICLRGSFRLGGGEGGIAVRIYTESCEFILISLRMRGQKLCGRSCEIVKKFACPVCARLNSDIARGSRYKNWNKNEIDAREKKTNAKNRLNETCIWAFMSKHRNKIVSNRHSVWSTLLCHYYYGHRHIHLWNVNKFFFVQFLLHFNAKIVWNNQSNATK